MKLYYGLTSPYARKVLVVLLEKGLEAEIINTPPLEPNTPLNAVNPLGKIPALITDTGELLVNSPLICAYLNSLASDTPLLQTAGAKWSIQNLESLGDGIMDAAFSLTMEKNRPAQEQSSFWKERWRGAIERTVSYISSLPELFEEELNIGQISVAIALDYLLFRHPEINWQSQSLDLTNWHASFSQRPHLKTTHPDYKEAIT